MAIIIRDSFDFYGTPSDGGANFWDTFGTGSSLEKTITRMGQGQSLKLPGSNPASACSKSFTATGTVFCCFAMYPTTSSSDVRGAKFTFYDGTTVQAQVCFTDAGHIEVWQGGNSDDFSGGTLLQKFLYASSAHIWTHWQIKIVFDGTNGEVHIRKNGNPNDDYTVAGISTIKSANAQATRFALNYGKFGGTADRYFDDLAVWDATGTGPWTDWVGDIRAVVVMPSGDTTQKDFAATPTSAQFGSNGTGNTFNPTAGWMEFCPVSASAGGVLGDSITMKMRSAMTGKVVVGLYDSDGPGGQPGTLLAYAPEVTNPVAGDNALTLNTTLTLKSGRTYWWGTLWSASSGSLEIDSGSSPIWYEYRPTYSSTLPADVGSETLSTFNARRACLHGTIATTNSGLLSELPTDDGTTFVSDDQVGDYDLYTTDGLPVTPHSILGVSVRGFAAKSDAGARSGAIVLKSGSTEAASGDQVLSTSWINLVMYQDTDPATGAAWTESGINAAQLGPKVTA